MSLPSNHRVVQQDRAQRRHVELRYDSGPRETICGVRMRGKWWCVMVGADGVTCPKCQAQLGLPAGT